MHLNKSLSIALVVSIFAGCASTASTESAESPPSSDDCFHIREITGWDAIDKDHIYLKEVGNDHYLLTMFSSCPGIKFANAIALSNHMGRVCPNDFGRVTYRDGGMRASCQIDDVERVASKEAAKEIVAARKSEEESPE